MRFYSQSTGSTYLKGVHSIPDDAIPISEELFLSVIGNPAPGKIRAHDASGLPILIDQPPPTEAEIAAQERQWRDAELASVLWLRERHRDQQEIGAETALMPEQFTELLTYMQALRDWPQSEAFPCTEQRPVALPWITDQTK